MVKILKTEFIKLKRSQLFIMSFIGAITAPFVNFIAMIGMRHEDPTTTLTYSYMFTQSNMFVMLLVGIPLYGVITAYLFNREYLENTIKNILTIPISRTKFFMAKFIYLAMWIIILTIIAWLFSILFGIIGQFEGLSAQLIFSSLGAYLIGGICLFLLSTPIIFISIVLKNYVTTIVCTLVITMVNVLIIQSKYLVLYPWSASHAIATQDFIKDYPPFYSYFSIAFTFTVGFIASLYFFINEDIK